MIILWPPNLPPREIGALPKHTRAVKKYWIEIAGKTLDLRIKFYGLPFQSDGGQLMRSYVALGSKILCV